MYGTDFRIAIDCSARGEKYKMGMWLMFYHCMCHLYHWLNSFPHFQPGFLSILPWTSSSSEPYHRRAFRQD